LLTKSSGRVGFEFPSLNERVTIGNRGRRVKPGSFNIELDLDTLEQGRNELHCSKRGRRAEAGLGLAKRTVAWNSLRNPNPAVAA